MDLRLSEFQQLLANSAQDFLSREVPYDRVRQIEASATVDRALWKQVVDLGWAGLPIAEAYGGQGATIVDLGVLINELCRAATPLPYVQSMLGALVVQQCADSALKQALLPRLAAGAVITPAHLEASDDLAAPPTVRYAKGAVSGEKHFVEYGADSDLYLVSAIDGRTPGLAVVARDQAGVRTRPLVGLGSTPLAVVTFTNARAEAWIPGQAALDYLRGLGAALTAVESYACAQKALDLTVDYAQMRVQFGRPIGAFGPVQGRVADMAVQTLASRFLAFELLEQFDTGAWTAARTAVVKGVTARMLPLVLMDAHLIHGGMGFMREYHLQFYTRRGKEAGLRWGTARECTNAIGDALAG